MKLFLQLDLMRDLLILLYQIQAFRKNRIILVLILSDLHEHLDHVLYTVADTAFVEHGAESLEDSRIGFG